MVKTLAALLEATFIAGMCAEAGLHDTEHQVDRDYLSDWERERLDAFLARWHEGRDA